MSRPSLAWSFCLLVDDYPVKVLHLRAAPSPLNRDDSFAYLLTTASVELFCGFRGATLTSALAP